jgi:hypothetical protein
MKWAKEYAVAVEKFWISIAISQTSISYSMPSASVAGDGAELPRLSGCLAKSAGRASTC